MSLYKRLKDSIKQIAAEFAVAEGLPKVGPGLGVNQPTQMWSGAFVYWTLWDGGSVELEIQLAPIGPSYFGKEDEAPTCYVEVTSWYNKHPAGVAGQTMNSERNFDAWLRTNLRSRWDDAKEKSEG